MQPLNRILSLALITMAFSVSAGCFSSQGNPGSTPVPVPVSLSPGATQNVSIELMVAKMSFDRSAITVPAGSDVTVNFHNRESEGSSQVTGIAHNFAVYDSPAAKNVIFRGEIVTGGQNVTYHFTAPSVPGTYFFRCDVHPLVMNGSFIVQ